MFILLNVYFGPIQEASIYFIKPLGFIYSISSVFWLQRNHSIDWLYKSIDWFQYDEYISLK